jgi:hypothetical protein
MRIVSTLVALFLASQSFAQNAYWQQEVSYNINVALNDREHSLKGFLDLEYTNNSPDKLDFIWFHIWPNAYKNEQTAFARQLFREKDGAKRWKAIKDKGYIDSLQFMANGQPLKTEAHPEHIDVIKVLLPSSLASGQKIKISTPFYVKLATYNSRSGHDGQSYIVCQWYPKPAVYDRKGWHEMPYLDQGEFYSEFGTFDVSITLPSNYIVGASGQLRTTGEQEQYMEMGKKNVAASTRKNVIPYKAPATPVKTLRYSGTRMHDFAWFADKDFVVRYDTLQLASGKQVDVFAFHHPDGNKNWVSSIDYIESATRAYSGYLGEYEYPVVQAVEGPKNEMSGGMEYPMITLITSPTANGEMLDAVITHEVGHNWLYGMLASNERQHPWMDEGINSYYQFRYEAEKYKGNSIFGDEIPAEIKTKPVDEFQALIYNAMSKIPMEGAIDTHSAAFAGKNEYGMISYLKTSLWIYLFELNYGKQALNKAMQAYFSEWKFRHPYPEDLKAVMERELGQGLDAFFAMLKQKGSL